MASRGGGSYVAAMNNRQIAIFGGTGTVGSELVRRALGSGYHVRALVRRPAAVAAHADTLELVTGDVREPSAVSQTLAGSGAVLSTLGAGRGDDPTTRRVGTANILDAMRDAGIRRLVAMGGFHYRVPGDPGNPGQKLVGALLHLAPGVDVEDTEELARVVTSSDRDWTFVRSPRVAPGKRAGSYQTGILRLGPWSSVASGDIAAFMLHCLDDETQVRRAPMIRSD
jgi:putative NADH-flavin reductase